MTHPKDASCPFGEHPTGPLAPCCSYRGNPAALYLVATGLAPLAIALYQDTSPEGAVEMAEGLRSAVEGLREAVAEGMRKGGVPATESVDDATNRVSGVGWNFRLGDALAELEATAFWYEKVGQMGFGVKAWF